MKWCGIETDDICWLEIIIIRIGIEQYGTYGANLNLI